MQRDRDGSAAGGGGATTAAPLSVGERLSSTPGREVLQEQPFRRVRRSVSSGCARLPASLAARDSLANPPLVRVDPYDGRAHDAHAVSLNPADGRAEVSPLLEVELLAKGHKSLHSRGFEPDGHALAPRPRGEIKQFVMVGEVDGCLADPRPGQPLPNHRSEEILGVCEMITVRTDEVIIHEEDNLFPNQPQFSNDIRDGPLAERTSIERGDATKAQFSGQPRVV